MFLIALTRPQLFAVGDVHVTKGAEASAKTNHILTCLGRHVTGDFGGIPADDVLINLRSISEGGRIFSAYPLDPHKPSKGYGDNTMWIITEADRRMTTILLPSEY